MTGHPYLTSHLCLKQPACSESSKASRVWEQFSYSKQPKQSTSGSCWIAGNFQYPINNKGRPAEGLWVPVPVLLFTVKWHRWIPLHPFMYVRVTGHSLIVGLSFLPILSLSKCSDACLYMFLSVLLTISFFIFYLSIVDIQYYSSYISIRCTI